MQRILGWAGIASAGNALFMLVLCGTATAQTPPVVVPRASGSIQLDGTLDEPAWDAALRLPVVMQSPRYGEPPSDSSDFRLTFDDQFLYLGGRLYAAPENVFATSFKRDLWTTATDWFGICLDSFNDNENALCFYTTPTGLRLDYTIANDAQGSEAADPSWNTYWDVAAGQNEYGWFAELRIPFSSLRFQDQDGHATMGVIAARYVSRRNEWIVHPDVPPRWGFWSFAKPSQAARVRFAGLDSRKPVHVAPYALAGIGQDHRLNAAETGYRRIDDPTTELGLDLKYGLTNNLTLDLTANTDFAQVEADDQQINLTRFSLFFPEKRQFFLERSSIFNFNIGGDDHLFYSRRIGLVDNAPVPILGGARMVGRVGQWDVGMLDMQTARVRGGSLDGGRLPSENFGVLRLRRQVLNPYSYAGAVATSRIDVDGAYNVTYGADGIVRLFGNDYVSAALAQTLDDRTPDGTSVAARTRLHVQWERRTLEGFGFDLGVTRSGRAFDPGIGFQLREGFTRLGNRILMGWVPGEKSFLQRHQVGVEGAAFFRNADVTTETVEAGPFWSGVTKSGAALDFTLDVAYDDLRAPFRLSDGAGVETGSYTFYQLLGSVETPQGRLVRLLVTGRGGTFYDGSLVGGSIEPTWSTSRYLELAGSYGVSHVRFGQRDQRHTVHVARLRVQVTLNTSLSGAAFVQYNSDLDAVVANVRFRYNPREGNDLYLVYNEGYNTNRNGFLPALPPFSNRTILLKFVHTFIL